MSTSRIAAITSANRALLSFLPVWEKHRGTPGVADLAFGNPQEMVVQGFAGALASATSPQNKDHYAYKFSEPESQPTI